MLKENFLGFFTWDPDRIFFTVPGIHHPITWYGCIFALGFFIGYLVVRFMFAQYLLDLGEERQNVKKRATLLVDRLTFWTVLGTVIGARLGHVFFYGWPYYKEHPLSIIKVWEGGLASHGAAAGILIALILFLFWTKRQALRMNFLMLLDVIVVPAAFIGGCIRIGNFINQEILGIPTSLPWGVIFLHPIEGPAGVPLHPVQLYESFFYFLVFAILWALWLKGGKKIGTGLLSGTFFLFVFGFRFCIEFLKLPQSQLIDENVLNMGQWLSLPFVMIGIILLATYPIRHIKSNSWSQLKNSPSQKNR